MKLHMLFRKLDELWLGIKILAAQWTALAFALAAVVAFGIVALDLGAEGLRWLRAGSWTNSKTIAEAFPVSAEIVAGLKWLGIRRAAVWAISHSVLWLYAALGVACFVICGIFLEIGDRLQARRRYRQLPHDPNPHTYNLDELRLSSERETAATQDKGLTPEGDAPPAEKHRASVSAIARRHRPGV
jgi:hypothetical protein